MVKDDYVSEVLTCNCDYRRVGDDRAPVVIACDATIVAPGKRLVSSKKAK